MVNFSSQTVHAVVVVGGCSVVVGSAVVVVVVVVSTKSLSTMMGSNSTFSHVFPLSPTQKKLSTLPRKPSPLMLSFV